MSKPKIATKNMKIEMKKSSYIDPVSRIRIISEGMDESGNLYVKLGIYGTTRSVGPYSMKELIKSRDRLFTDLSNAGVKLSDTQGSKRTPQCPPNSRVGAENYQSCNAARLVWRGFRTPWWNCWRRRKSGNSFWRYRRANAAEI